MEASTRFIIRCLQLHTWIRKLSCIPDALSQCTCHDALENFDKCQICPCHDALENFDKCQQEKCCVPTATGNKLITQKYTIWLTRPIEYLMYSTSALAHVGMWYKNLQSLATRSDWILTTRNREVKENANLKETNILSCWCWQLIHARQRKRGA
jgi:hypothetical protein